VPLRHFNLAVSSANIANTYALSEKDVSLCIMPLFHIHGLIGSTMATLLTGGTVVVPTKFNALSFWRTVREHNVTWYSGVPHDAPTFARTGPAQSGGGQVSALCSFLQRADVCGTHSQKLRKLSECPSSKPME
jgi:acyl-coenzyme A synthetase/AMP-(fatty) acid ligase